MWPDFLPDIRGIVDMPMPLGMSTSTFHASGSHFIAYITARKMLNENTHRTLTPSSPELETMTHTATWCADAYDRMLYEDYKGPGPGLCVKNPPVIYAWYSVLQCLPYQTEAVAIAAGDDAAYCVYNLCYHTTVIWFELLMLRTLEAALLTNSDNPVDVARARGIWHTNATHILRRWWPAYRRFHPGIVRAKFSSNTTLPYLENTPLLPELLEETHWAMEKLCLFRLHWLQCGDTLTHPLASNFHAAGFLRDAVYMLDIGAGNARAKADYRHRSTTVSESAGDDYGLWCNYQDMRFLHNLYEAGGDMEFLHEEPGALDQTLSEWMWQTMDLAWSTVRHAGAWIWLWARPTTSLIETKKDRQKKVIIRKIKEVHMHWVAKYNGEVYYHGTYFPANVLFVKACGVSVARENVSMTGHALSEAIYGMLYKLETTLVQNVVAQSNTTHSTGVLMRAMLRMSYPWSASAYKSFHDHLDRVASDADNIVFVHHPQDLVGPCGVDGRTHVLGVEYTSRP